MKKFELEFSVDPLFKKASADFDEGGAKGLLLNHLAIDAHGRIVFDSSDDIETSGLKSENGRLEGKTISSELYESSEERLNQIICTSDEQTVDIDLSALGSKFFPNLDQLDSQDLCPSLRLLDLEETSGPLDIPFLKAPEDWRQRKDDGSLANLDDKSGIFLDDDNAIGFEDENEPPDNFQSGLYAGFGEGGDAWARDVKLEPQLRTGNPDSGADLAQAGESGGTIEMGGPRVTDPIHTTSLRHGTDEGGHGDILSYFDQALQKSWAGPEHWRIRRMKDNTKAPSVVQTKRREREPFEIDFASSIDPTLAELIYTPAVSTSTISLSRTQRVSKTRNLLPDDKHFSSRHLVRLFLKPKARISTRHTIKGGRRSGDTGICENAARGEIDEVFWAQQDIERTPNNGGQDDEPHGHYDASFFQDDGLPFIDSLPDDDDGSFTDAREAFSPGINHAPSSGTNGLEHMLLASSQDGPFGSQLVTQNKRLRPDYVQYARVAKKVDVRRLKEEMWKGFGFKEVRQSGRLMCVPPLNLRQDQPDQRSPPAQDTLEEDCRTISFTGVMKGLQQVYPTQAMADISTSYCFICLLHLANEKGLDIRDDEGLDDLKIQQDPAAEIT